MITMTVTFAIKKARARGSAAYIVTRTGYTVMTTTYAKSAVVEMARDRNGHTIGNLDMFGKKMF